MKEEDSLDAAPAYAWWVPERALRDLEMEKALHGHESHAQLARRLMSENLPMAVMAIVHMAVQSSDERTRFNASKYIIDMELGTASASGKTPDGEHAWEKVYKSVLVEAEDITKSA